MKKALLVCCICMASVAQGQIASHIVLSEIYGGGGNAGSAWKNDFIELYNPTACPVSLNGWSVQYASSTGNSWQVTNLSGSIPAKGFYLIQEAIGAGGTTSLPTPDAAGSIAMSATAGKVALVNTTTALSGTCPTGSQIIDFVGFGSTANCYEGSAPASAPSNTTSLERKASSTSSATTLATGGSEVTSGNGYDADLNSSDLVVQSLSSINPQNTASSIEGTVGNTVSVAAGIAPAEPSTNGTFTISLSAPAPSGGITVSYTLSGTATSGTDYTDVQAGSVTIPQSASTGTINLSIINDLIAEGNETIIVTLGSAGGGYSVCSGSATVTITDDDISTTLIHSIQGAGASATAGTYTAEAIVTGVYPSLSPAGFYMQEENSDADANVNTSEGIFVVSSASVAVGDKVQVTGTVQENALSPSFDQAVFTGATVAVINHGNSLPSAVTVSLPVTAASDFEKYEGMLVTFPATLTVTNNYDLGRYGEVGLSAGGVVYQPTQVIDPNDNPASGTTSTGTSNVPAINALINANALRTILLDDGFNTTTALPYVDPTDSTLRIGSTVTNLTGIMGYAFSTYRIQPIPSSFPAFSYNPRPAVPGVGSSNIKVASFNVLNYFNGNGLGGGFPTSRGANSLAEFNRQRAKIISAISQMNADIVGLTEIENDGVGSTSAIQDLVNGLNTVMGAGTYSIINDGASIQTNSSDEIRCGIIYKSSVVTPSGAVMLSANSIFNRPPVAQAFTLQSTNVKFNFIINHLKSKGCSGSTGADLDQSDGQSCFNARRKSQAGELANFISGTVVPASGSSLTISVGDYNSYEEEDPLDSLRSAGYIVLGNSGLYSYQFDGQIGALDHAVVSSALNTFVTGFAKWNINAAEPVFLDYDDAINDGGTDVVNPFAGTYTTSPFRSSDHDPVLIGLNLPAALSVAVTAFDVVKRGHSAWINWTIQEPMLTEFLVERAEDNDNWHSVASIKAAANQSGPINYSAVDAAPRTGINLYRLKWLTSDGGQHFSPVKKLVFDAAAVYSIYPNPAKDRLYLTVNGKSQQNTAIRILNMMSQPVYSGQWVDSNPVQLDISSWMPGVYYIRFDSVDKGTEVFRFEKQ